MRFFRKNKYIGLNKLQNIEKAIDIDQDIKVIELIVDNINNVSDKDYMDEFKARALRRVKFEKKLVDLGILFKSGKLSKF